MSTIEWIVIIGGLTAIVWVNWYFFMAQAIAGKQIQKTEEPRQLSMR
ncbi:hypothetical protein [Nitrospira sp. Ecomares 2.1]